MTGYGRGDSSAKGVQLAVEISSVNRRQVEVAVSLPSELDSSLRPTSVKSSSHQWRVVESRPGDLAASLRKGQPLDPDQRSAG